MVLINSKEMLQFIEGQIEWISDIQSQVSENKRRYKMWHAAVSSLITEQSNKQRHREIQTDENLEYNHKNTIEIQEYAERTESWDDNMAETWEYEQDEEENECGNKNITAQIYNNVQNEVIHIGCTLNEITGEMEEGDDEADTNDVIIEFVEEVKMPSETQQQQEEYTCDGSQKNSVHNTQLVEYSDKTDQDSNDPNRKGPACSFCGKRFKWKSMVKRHELMHTGAKPFPCDRCNKSYTTKYHLETHKVTHSEERSHKCPICRRTFKLICNLHRHMELHKAGSDEKTFKCTQCEKAYKRKEHLVRHRKQHTDKH